MTDVDKLVRRYIAQGLGLTLLLTAVATVVALVWMPDQLTAPIVVSMLFCVVADVAEALIWQRVATRSPESLPTFYTAVSGFRLLLALATMFGYYLAAGRSAMLVFFLVFMAFYVVQLIHHSLYFANISSHS